MRIDFGGFRLIYETEFPCLPTDVLFRLSNY